MIAALAALALATAPDPLPLACDQVKPRIEALQHDQRANLAKAIGKSIVLGPYLAHVRRAKKERDAMGREIKALKVRQAECESSTTPEPDQ